MIMRDVPKTSFTRLRYVGSPQTMAERVKDSCAAGPAHNPVLNSAAKEYHRIRKAKGLDKEDGIRY
jgi:hypothetical protein